MKLAIVGSRNILNVNFDEYDLENVTEIITGGACGVDELAEKYADKKRISKHIIRPEYKLYKRGAPIIRNKKIVDLSDEVLVFWDGKSKGTKSVIDYAIKINKPIKIIQFNL